ncbi:unnamed protein product, partial [Prorocentrum cordatum]
GNAFPGGPMRRPLGGEGDFFKRIEQMCEDGNKKLADRIEGRIGRVEERLGGVDMKLGGLEAKGNVMEARLAKLELGQKATREWQPSCIAIAFFLASGRAGATWVATGLSESGPAKKSSRICQNNLGRRSATSRRTMQIRVASSHVGEIMGRWSEFMSRPVNHRNGRAPRAREERHPALQARFNKCGEVCDFAQSMGFGTVTVEWAPVFQVRVDFEVAVSIAEKGALAWDQGAATSLGEVFNAELNQ